MNRDYYGGDDPYEAIRVIRAWGLNFALGSVLKYIKRHGNKPGEDAITCLTKARDYLDDEIRALEASDATGEAGGAGEDSVASETGTNAAEQGFRVGARVRVLGTARTASYYGGCEGTIAVAPLGRTDWLVRLDLGRGLAHFHESELEVIE